MSENCSHDCSSCKENCSERRIQKEAQNEFSNVKKVIGVVSGKGGVGKRVGVFPLIPCKECVCCQKEQYEMCSNYNYLGSRCDGIVVAHF